MKVTLFLIGTIVTCLLGAGCTPSAAPSSSLSSTSSPDEAERLALDRYRKTPDRLVWQADASVKGAIISQLTVGNKIREITTPRKVTVPSNIYPPQLVKFFELADMQFAIVQVLSGVGLERWDQKTTLNSGVWYIDKDDTVWKPLVVLIQSEPYRPHNNIFDVWDEGSGLHLLLVDSYGAGSGEGTAKVVSFGERNIDGEVKQCFYFANGEFYNLQKKLGSTSIHETISSWLNPKVNDFLYAQEYRYNSLTKNFETLQFSKETNRNEIITNEECKNVIFSSSVIDN